MLNWSYNPESVCCQYFMQGFCNRMQNLLTVIKRLKTGHRNWVKEHRRYVLRQRLKESLVYIEERYVQMHEIPMALKRPFNSTPPLSVVTKSILHEIQSMHIALETLGGTLNVDVQLYEYLTIELPVFGTFQAASLLHKSRLAHLLTSASWSSLDLNRSDSNGRKTTAQPRTGHQTFLHHS